MRSILPLVFALACLTNAGTIGKEVDQDDSPRVLPGEYIVELRPGSHIKRGFTSPHAELYHNLARRGTPFEVEAEYNSKVLTAAAVKLTGDVNLALLANLPNVMAIRPVYAYTSPEPIEVQNTGKVGSNGTGTNALNFAWTGIDRLHAQGLTGKGIKIAILEKTVEVNHPALGGGVGPGSHSFKVFDANSVKKNVTCKTSPHGTMVAGVIGARPGSNPHNITGVAYEASLAVYRLGCSIDDITLASALTKAFDDGNDIISVSLGFSGDAWAKSNFAITMGKVAREGRITIFAAGNEGFMGSWATASDSKVISVGNADSSTKFMASDSTWSPSHEMTMTPSVSAPGTKIHTTDIGGAYKVVSGTSFAAPFVAGAAALLLQARGNSDANRRAIQSLLQNTAASLSGRNNLLEPVSHQGAGLIQVHDALKSTASMLPAEMLLNDTAHYRGSHQLTIKNNGNSTITYKLAHTPTGTAATVHTSNQTMITGDRIQSTDSPALVSVQPSTLTVPAGQAMSVNVTIQPPSGLDAKSFPVFSGYVVAKGSDNSTLRSTYLGVAATLKDMQVIEMFRPPQIKDIEKKEEKIYTMEDKDIPTVTYRLAGGTAKLLIDLVDPSSGGSSSTQSKPVGDYLSPGYIGRVFEANYTTRQQLNLAFPSGQRIEFFTNNTAVPTGKYAVLVRALKINGNPSDANDWESWKSQPFIVARQPVITGL